MPSYGITTRNVLADGTLDLDPTFKLLDDTSSLVVAEAVTKRWHSARGSVFYDADLGEPIFRQLSARLPRDEDGSVLETALFQIGVALRTEAEKDERVESCEVTVTFDEADKALDVEATITTSESETFDLVLSVSETSVDLLLPTESDA